MSTNRKYGRLPRQFDQRVPHMSSVRLMRSVQLPALPVRLDNAATLPADLGVMLNDRDGCCTCSGLGHAEQVWTKDAQGSMVTVPDSSIADAYRQVAGWDGVSGSPSDAGAAEQTVLSWASTVGLLQSDGSRQRLSAFVEIDPRNPRDVCEAIYEAGLVYIGFSVPNLLPEDAGSLWDGAVDLGPIEGGHCVICPGYTNPSSPVLDVISWGDRYRMNWAFWERYVDECYCLFSPLWVAPSGKTPYGLDATALEALMQAIRA